MVFSTVLAAHVEGSLLVCASLLYVVNLAFNAVEGNRFCTLTLRLFFFLAQLSEDRLIMPSTLLNRS